MANLVNYRGDGRLLSEVRVRRMAGYVLENYWRHPVPLPAGYVLDINVVGSESIKNINREYLGRDRPTDVIAFSFAEEEGWPREDPPLLGQILISRPAVSLQARELGHSRREEIKTLIIHGLLHIAGWEEGEEIQNCQTKIKELTDRLI